MLIRIFGPSRAGVAAGSEREGAVAAGRGSLRGSATARAGRWGLAVRAGGQLQAQMNNPTLATEGCKITILVTP
jgi:hypothetical protein